MPAAAKSQAKQVEVQQVAKPRIPGVMKSKKADLEFPVARIGRMLRKGCYFQRYSDATAVFLAAVLEFLSGEVLDLAGIQAKNEGRKRIVPTNIFSGIQEDAGLVELFSNIIISEGGCNENIQEVLFADNLKSNTRSQSRSQSQKSKGDVNAKEPKAKEPKAIEPKAKDAAGKSTTRSKSKDVKEGKAKKDNKDGKKSNSKADGKKSGSKSQSKSKVRAPKSQKTSQAV